MKRQNGIKLIVFIVLLLSVSSVVFAEPVHTTLLAAQEFNDTLTGHTADLYLEVQPGRSRVFLETFPLTKIDTQISTRFAKEIACHYFDLSCDASDFIYTIQSDSFIIGGPSAGAALAAVTAAAVIDAEINQSVAVTGTINSGGLIGPVGGLKAKIDAASKANLKKVLIPIGMRLYNQSRNREGKETIDLVEYGSFLGIEVIEVSNLNEVMFHFTGRTIDDGNGEFSLPPQYVELMKNVSKQLCTRTEELKAQLNKFQLNKTQRDDVQNRTLRAEQASQEHAYYSAASYCFGLNVQLKNQLYEKITLTPQKAKAKVQQLEQVMEKFRQQVDEQELKTITDIQTLAVVRERLHDAQRALEEFKEDSTNVFRLAFAEERFFSAQSWSTFFSMEGHEYELNDAVLQRSCTEKIQEAREREQYIDLFFPSNIGNQIDRADEQRTAGEYELCLMIASQAKADANAIVGSIGIEQSELPRLIESKLDAIESLIARTAESQAFPLLGFSYYEYAQSLKEYDEGSALLYAEYALEMSNLDIYFEDKQPQKFTLNVNYMPFALGFVGGVVLMLFVMLLTRDKKKKRRV